MSPHSTSGFIYSVIRKVFISIYYVPGTGQGTDADTAMNKTNKTPCSQRASLLASETDDKQSR